MAFDPTAVADYTLQQNNIAGFAEAFLLEKLGLLTCGLMTIDSDAVFAQGNVWQVRGDVQDSTALQTPVAGTDLDVNDIAKYAMNGIIARRFQVYGINDLAKIAAGDPAAELRWARTLEHNLRLGLAKLIHEKLFPGLFTETTGCLSGTHRIDTLGAGLDGDVIIDALRVWGENGLTAGGILMHSYVRSALYKQGIVENAPADLQRELNETGIRYGGRIMGTEIYVDDMCTASVSNAAGTYESYLFKPGAMQLGYDGQLITTEIGRDFLSGGGANMIKGMIAFGPHVMGTTTTLTPTAEAGATDAEIALVTNWAKRSGVVAAEIGIVNIHSTEA